MENIIASHMILLIVINLYSKNIHDLTSYSFQPNESPILPNRASSICIHNLRMSQNAIIREISGRNLCQLLAVDVHMQLLEKGGCMTIFTLWVPTNLHKHLLVNLTSGSVGQNHPIPTFILMSTTDPRFDGSA